MAKAELPDPMLITGVHLIEEERARHADEFHNADGDDERGHGELASAAACYAIHARGDAEVKNILTRKVWPADMEDMDMAFAGKPYIRRLTLAGSLIAAEIDKVLREHDTAETRQHVLNLARGQVKKG